MESSSDRIDEFSEMFKDVNVPPCPFCGWDVDVLDYDCIYPVTRDKTVWGLHCLNHDCNASILGDSPQECVEKWSKRS